MRRLTLLVTLALAGCPDDPLPPRVPDTADSVLADTPPEAPDLPEADVAAVDIPDPPDSPPPEISDVPDHGPDLSVPDVPVDPPPTAAEVARYFAPIWYQDTADGGQDGQGPRADIPTAVDYDGDLIHNNNWDNLPKTAIHAQLYWGLVATDTHYFLTYAHYHPRDWEQLCTGLFTECHEGDMEEIQLVVRRGEDGYGELRVLRAHHHGHTTTYAMDAAIEAKAVEVDGAFDLESAGGEISEVQTADHHHVRIFAEAKGHGLAPCKASEQTLKPFGIANLSCPDGQGKSFPGDDGLRLVPAEGEFVNFKKGMELSGEPLGYELVPIAETMWQWRDQIGKGALFKAGTEFVYGGARGEPFVTDTAIGGKFDPDQFPNDSSSGRAPWNLSMEGSNQGDAFLDPAFAFDQALTWPEPWSLDYTEHPYLPAAVDNP